MSEIFDLSQVCLIVLTLSRLSDDNMTASVLGAHVAVKAITGQKVKIGIGWSKIKAPHINTVTFINNNVCDSFIFLKLCMRIHLTCLVM